MRRTAEAGGLQRGQYGHSRHQRRHPGRGEHRGRRLKDSQC